MGWCHEFGPQIAESCEHPMTAHTDRCECTVCGVVCTGRFAGCGAVWARGPREVAINAPHLGNAEGASDALGARADADRWRVPLESAAPTRTSTPATPEIVRAPAARTEARPPLARVFGSEPEPTTPLRPDVEPAAIAAHHDEHHDEPTPVIPALEPPDVTARYAVAQLEQLNQRLTGLTTETLERTEAALDKVAAQLEKLRAQREIDLTEQAAGVFGAVQTGADSLAAFSQTVAEVSDDLRAILTDALKGIGGTAGLAELVASSAVELNETREQFAASLGRIERDITLLRRRANAEAKEAKSPKPMRLDDEQVHYIVDAVTDNVLAALEQGGRKKR